MMMTVGKKEGITEGMDTATADNGRRQWSARRRRRRRSSSSTVIDCVSKTLERKRRKEV